MIVKPRQLGGPGPLGAVAPWEEEEEEYIGGESIKSLTLMWRVSINNGASVHSFSVADSVASRTVQRSAITELPVQK
jgi:hypothetical protein